MLGAVTAATACVLPGAPASRVARLPEGRRKVGTLTAEQSDRLLRVARVLAAAEETFGNRDNAAAWLRRPTQVLAGESPIDLLDTDEGAREVETLLGRIGHGIAA